MRGVQMCVSGKDSGKLVDQLLPQGCCSASQFALQLLIESPSVGGLNRYGLIAVFCEVIRAGAHVQFPQFHRQLKAIELEIGTDPWHRLRGPFVKIHASVQAAGLLKIHTGVHVRLKPIHGSCFRLKEAKGIKVRTADGTASNKRINLLLRQPKRAGLAVPDISSTINHRPFMNTMAAEIGCPVAGRDEEIAYPPQASCRGATEFSDWKSDETF